jgi:hypothetical protein
MFLTHQDAGRLNPVGGEQGRRGTGLFRIDQGKIPFPGVPFDTAADPSCQKSLSRANAAVYVLHKLSP